VREEPSLGDDPATARLRAERDLYRKLLAIGDRDDVEPFLDDALALLVEVTGAARGYLEIADPAAGGRVRFRSSRALEGEALERARTGVSRGIVADALASGRTVQTASAMTDPRFAARESVHEMQIAAVLCVPIGSTPVLGVAYLEGRSAPGSFPPDDVARAETVARGLALHVERWLLRLRTGEEPDATAEVRRTFPAETLVGRSRALARALREAALVAPRDVNVLLVGESGTGKTELARLLWRHGPRAGAPFVELNCAAIPANLAEQELFGSEAGAHSTATRPVPGKVRAADGGVLFLDEVGELPIEVQAKLLQCVESRTFWPLGAAAPVQADVRIVAATNVDLEEAVREKRFRADLYWRLSTFPIRLPSLAERTGDVPLLAVHLAERLAAAHGHPDLQISEAALQAVWTAPWPGNVRELSSRLEAAVLRAIHDRSPRIARRHVFPDADAEEEEGGEDGAAPAPSELTWHEAQQRFQRRLLADTLAATDWNVAEAARRLDLARSHLYALMQAHGLRRGR
jgi:Nif-specific regulatory protein